MKHAGTRAEPDTPWTEQIRLSGIVQGVGMRPWIYRQASLRALSGSVCNDASGVRIVVAGDRLLVDDLVRAMQDAPPPLSRIERIDRQPSAEQPAAGFRIIDSRAGLARTGVAPDAATCADCLAEIFDPANRRYRYPFTNCTHCGPRFSILRTVPYDRCNTSMDAFTMCPACTDEYHDPRDRRFHAQPNACPACGPQAWLERSGAGPIEPVSRGAESIEQARALLSAGHIVAVKGLGGFHLACDASQDASVARLRERKLRGDKPFALMARDLDMVERYCKLSSLERGLLQSPQAPILLLAADGPEKLAACVAPGQSTLGFMLPYTPLHHLLVHGMEQPIVLTSGNLSDEPQCVGNEEARGRLGAIADFFLLHNRDIVSRVDDSVLRASDGRPRWLRRARGVAPATLPLPPGLEAAPPVLALGGELKNTFCLARDGQATLSQHLGDLEHAQAWTAWRDTLALYLRMFDHRQLVLAVDLHPDYLSSKLGRDWAHANRLALLDVQHHHAHIAACMADNEVPLDAGPVLGLALDGLGYGSDGSLWGGEFLLADYRGCRRLAAFRPIPMPGAMQAIREPWRMAYAALTQHLEWRNLQQQHGALEFFRGMQAKPLMTLDAMMRTGLNCPPTSSCGRLFDAMAALIGIRGEVNYEGQAAIELESCVDRTALERGESYPLALATVDGPGMAWIDARPLWPAVLRDLAQGLAKGRMAARFHNGLAAALVAMVEHLARYHGNPWRSRIALSGGVFQNATLFRAVATRLEAKGLTILSHARVPANDGGLAFGQAVVAAAWALARKPS